MDDKPPMCTVDGCTLELVKDAVPGVSKRAFGGRKVASKPDRVTYYCPKHGSIR
jgi:hypothetical protein